MGFASGRFASAARKDAKKNFVIYGSICPGIDTVACQVRRNITDIRENHSDARGTLLLLNR